jgi:hypothetical protein
VSGTIARYCLGEVIIMCRLVGFVLVALAGSVIGAAGALAEEAGIPARTMFSVGPNVAVATLPNPERGFEVPEPSAKFDVTTPVTIAGLGPGEDLRGTEAPVDPRLIAADLDAYTNSKDYQQLMDHYYSRGQIAPGTQFADLGKAMGGAVVHLGAKSLNDRLEERLDDQVDAGKLAPIDAVGLDVGLHAGEFTLATAPVILNNGGGGLGRKGAAVGKSVLGHLVVAGIGALVKAEN